MFLGQMKPGQRFLFEDKKTPLTLPSAHGQFAAVGVFQFMATSASMHGGVVLWSERTRTAIVPVAGTVTRSVLVIN